MQMQATPVQVDPDQLKRVVNALLAESCLGFERRLEGGEFQWRGQQINGEWSEWSSDVLDFCGDDELALQHAKNMCNRHGLSFNLSYSPVHHWVCTWGHYSEQINWEAFVAASSIAGCISVSLCGFLKLDIAGTHKLLYPGSYLMEKPS